MNYIIEAIFVGIYCIILYLLFNPFIKNIYLLLFICGTFKHFIGINSGLLNWYCNNGDACIKMLDNKYYYIYTTNYLLPEIIYEGVLFVIVGGLLHYILPKSITMFFMIGFILHISSEYIGIHRYVCKKKCKGYKNIL